MFEGLLADCNSKLHVTSTHYNDPIALKLVQISKRCLSLHGLSDTGANGKIQIGGLDTELMSIVLEELTAAGIPVVIVMVRAQMAMLPRTFAIKLQPAPVYS